MSGPAAIEPSIVCAPTSNQERYYDRFAHAGCFATHASPSRSTTCACRLSVYHSHQHGAPNLFLTRRSARLPE